MGDYGARAHDTIEGPDEYGHLDDASLRPTVRAGDEVDAGDPLAAVGMSGLTTGPHLHLAVRRGGEPIDPRSFLPQR